METAAHSAFAKRMSASKEMERVRRLYDELAEQLKARYPEKVIPTVEMVQKTLDNFQTEFDKASKEYQFYKKEMDRLAKEIQKKRDSEKAVKRFLENEQQVKRKKNTLE